jgi:hypothetical protein
LNKKIHIICFDVPFPATYGGVMDVFCKIQALSKKGAEIYLHVFQYGRPEQAVLKEYCTEVHYYKRKTSFFHAFGTLPYVVSSRRDGQLVENLKRIDAPILMEGLHSTLVLRKKLFKDRKMLVRTHNVEHQYYKQLAITETNLFKKIYYQTASVKLKYYENVLKHCDHILPISKHEALHFTKKYGDKVTFLAAFHPNNKLHELSKKGYFAFYHGNLDVSDNMKTALFLIDIFKSMPYPLVIAGQSSDTKLLSKIDQYKNISFISIEDDPQLLELFHRAHVNVLYSFNNSGVKLKLINSLFQSRYVIANHNAIEGSGLDSLCIIADDKKEIMQQVLKTMDKDFSKEEIIRRKEILSVYSNERNAEILLNLL